MIEKARRWYERCQSPIASHSENFAQYPPYYGFKSIFHADLVLSDRWTVELSPPKYDLDKALTLGAVPRFEKVLSYYSRAVEKLAAARISRMSSFVVCLSRSFAPAGASRNPLRPPKNVRSRGRLNVLKRDRRPSLTDGSQKKTPAIY